MAANSLPVLPFSVEGLLSALRSAAIPGYTGSIYVEFSLKPEAAEKVELHVTRRSMHKPDARQQQQTIPATGDPAREGPIQDLVVGIRDLLCIRPDILGVEAHYNDGVLGKYQVVKLEKI